MSTPYLSISQPHFGQIHPPQSRWRSFLGLLILGIGSAHFGQNTFERLMPSLPSFGHIAMTTTAAITVVATKTARAATNVIAGLTFAFCRAAWAAQRAEGVGQQRAVRRRG